MLIFYDIINSISFNFNSKKYDNIGLKSMKALFDYDMS